MPSVKPRINFVTDEILIKKMKLIADEKNRTLSKEVERLCKLHIKEYEEKNGEIKTA